MTDDGGIDIKHHKTLTDPAQNDYNTPLMQMKYSCTAIFGNVYCATYSDNYVYMNAFQTRKLSTELYVPVYSILISTPDPQTFHDHMQKITTDWKDMESKCVDYFM